MKRLNKNEQPEVYIPTNVVRREAVHHICCEAQQATAWFSCKRTKNNPLEDFHSAPNVVRREAVHHICCEAQRSNNAVLLASRAHAFKKYKVRRLHSLRSFHRMGFT
jgi:hypothetical protein